MCNVPSQTWDTFLSAPHGSGCPTGLVFPPPISLTLLLSSIWGSPSVLLSVLTFLSFQVAALCFLLSPFLCGSSDVIYHLKIIKSSESVSPAQTNNTLFSFSCPRTCPSSLAQWLYHSQSGSNQECGVIFNSFLCSAQSPTCTSSLTQDLFAPSLTHSLNLSPYHCSLGHFPCPNPNRPNSYLLSFQLPLSPFGGSFFQPCNHATSSLYDPRGTFLKTKESSLSWP